MLDLIDKSGEVTVRAGPDGGVQGGAKGGPPIASPPCAEAEWGGLAAEALAAARRDGGQGAVGGGAGPGAQGGRCPRPGADPDEAGGEAAGSWAWGGRVGASGCGETSFSPLFPSQVDKLRLLLLEKMDENSQLSDKYLEQVPGALRGPSSSHPLSPTLHRLSLPFNASSSHFPAL